MEDILQQVKKWGIDFPTIRYSLFDEDKDYNMDEHIFLCLLEEYTTEYPVYSTTINNMIIMITEYGNQAYIPYIVESGHKVDVSDTIFDKNGYEHIVFSDCYDTIDDAVKAIDNFMQDNNLGQVDIKNHPFSYKFDLDDINVIPYSLYFDVIEKGTLSTFVNFEKCR